MNRSPIAMMIDAAVSCVKCGTRGVGNCDCYIKLSCPKCGKFKWAERDDTDPLGTFEVQIPCPECSDDQSREMPVYYTAGGQVIST